MNLDDSLLFCIAITGFSALLFVGGAILAVIEWFQKWQAKRRAANCGMASPPHLRPVASGEKVINRPAGASDWS